MLNNEETNQNRRTNSGLTERHSNLKGSVPRRESRDPMRALNRNLTVDDPIGLTKRLVIVDSNTAHWIQPAFLMVPRLVRRNWWPFSKGLVIQSPRGSLDDVEPTYLMLSS